MFPLPAPVEECDSEKWPPENEVRHGNDNEHFDPRDALFFHLGDVGLDFVRPRRRISLKCAVRLRMRLNFENKREELNVS